MQMPPSVRDSEVMRQAFHAAMRELSINHPDKEITPRVQEAIVGAIMDLASGQTDVDRLAIYAANRAKFYFDK
jgi:hypothetical protein